jgi:hypothetical protein
MADEITRCSLCGWDAKVTHSSDVDLVKCEHCGEFKVTASLLATAFSDKESPRSEKSPAVSFGLYSPSDGARRSGHFAYKELEGACPGA